MGIFDVMKQLARELEITPETFAAKKNTETQKDYYNQQMSSLLIKYPPGCSNFMNTNSGGSFYLAYLITEDNIHRSLYILRANLMSTLKTKQTSLIREGIVSQIFEIELSGKEMPNLYEILKLNVMKKEFWPAFEYNAFIR